MTHSTLSPTQKKWLSGSIFILLCLLFTKGPDYYDHRIIKQIWESGHFILFAGLFLLLFQFEILRKLSFFTQLFLTITISIIIGVATEFLQLLVGRNFEFKDIINDLLGGLAGFLTHLISAKRKYTQNLGCIIGISMLTLIGLRPLLYAVIDEFYLYQNFPNLSDFETPYELGRWDYASASISTSEDIKSHGNQSMKVVFFPAQYPDITLNHFKRNWQDYNQINFSLFNTSNQTLTFELKIYDQKHPLSNYAFDDRFNLPVKMKPGWNHFSYPLKTIKSSLQHRKMEMQSVLSLSLFMINLKQEVIIYLDHVHLSR